MNMTKIGPIEILMGENGSRMPFSTSMVVKGQHDAALFDCGSGVKAFQYVQNEFNVKAIYLTHHHLDHTWGAHLFADAEIYINPLDYKKVVDTNELVLAQGFPAVLSSEEIEKLVEAQRKQPFPGLDDVVDRKLDIKGTYDYDQEFVVSDSKVMMIYAPGHTEGYCLPYFPEHGVLFAGDFDLTSFGPFYCDADGDIDLFIQSAYKTLEVDAKYYVTAHQRGIMQKDEYKKELDGYLKIIDKRDGIIKRFINAGKHPRDLTKQGIFYYEEQNNRNPFYLKSEKLGIAKHLERMIKQGEPFEEFYREFLFSQNIKEEYIQYGRKLSNSK